MSWKFGAIIGFALVGSASVRVLSEMPEARLPTTTRPVTVTRGHTARACDGGVLYAQMLDPLPESGDHGASERLAMDVSAALDCTTWTTAVDRDAIMVSLELSRLLVEHADHLAGEDRPEEATDLALDIWTLGQNLQEGTLVQHAVGIAVQSLGVDVLERVAKTLPPHRQRDVAEPILDLLDRSPAISFAGEHKYIDEGPGGWRAWMTPLVRRGSFAAAALLEPALAVAGPLRFDRVREVMPTEYPSRFSIVGLCQYGAMSVVSHIIWDQAELQQKAGVIASELVRRGRCLDDLSLLMPRMPVDPATGQALAYDHCEVRPAALPPRPTKP